jgi:hypothetical protein
MIKREQQRRISFSDSKYKKTFLVLIMALLTFGGPYLVHVLSAVLGIDYATSIVSGFILFGLGLALTWYMIKNEIISRD